MTISAVQLLVYTLLFSLLGIPLPTVVITNLEQIVAYATSVFQTADVLQDSLLNPNPLILLRPQTFDFIVVGAGSAGCVIASRLSENGTYSVLLLEAGGDPNLLNSIPALANLEVRQPSTDWLYESQPLQSGFGQALINNSIGVTRGKVLGGSSTLNLVVYQRGNPNDFDNWGNLVGDQQWNYSNVLPYFMKSEDYHGNYPDPSYHGTGGLLSISGQQSFHPLVQTWEDAGAELGYSTSDSNAYQTTTFAAIDTTVNPVHGSRDSSYTAFIEPFLARPNLHVVKYARVTKINFNSLKRAVSVTYSRLNEFITVKANKEIILCAGAIASPQLLKLSGIGPSAELTSFNITVIKDLPGVGRNLQDHVLTLGGPFILNDTVSFLVDRDLTTGDAAEYFLNGTGPFSFNFISSMGFVNVETPANPAWPNVYFTQAPLGIYQSFAESYEFVFGYESGTLTQYLNGFVGSDANFVAISLSRPKSSGSVKLASKNPFDKPIIDLGYYTDVGGQDMTSMINGYKFLVNMYENTTAWQKYNATLIPNHFPGCENYALRRTSWHQCCTAKMGNNVDPNAVLDSNLKVRGVTGLRVADASSWPAVTNANTNAPSIMTGEKAADIIINAWQ